MKRRKIIADKIVIELLQICFVLSVNFCFTFYFSFC